MDVLSLPNNKRSQPQDACADFKSLHQIDKLFRPVKISFATKQSMLFEGILNFQLHCVNNKFDTKLDYCLQKLYQ